VKLYGIDIHAHDAARRCEDTPLRGLLADAVYHDLVGIEDPEERERRTIRYGCLCIRWAPCCSAVPLIWRGYSPPSSNEDALITMIGPVLF
jgi:hypothetical protein